MAEKPIFAKKKKKNAAVLWIVFLIFFIPALAIGSYLLYLYLITVGPQNPLDPKGSKIFKNKDRVNILVVGLDENRDDKGILHHKGSRTDTIFVISIEKSGKRVGMLSIPRDTWTHISDKHGDDRINAAYGSAFWDVYSPSGVNYKEAMDVGRRQTQRVVENFLGITIDHYAVIKLEGAADLINAIGGIPIDVEKDMDYDDNWGNLHIHLKKGQQVLSGKDAVGYARFRHDEEGDWGRIRRQQQFIQALAAQVKNPKNFIKIGEILKVLKKNVDTSLTPEELIDTARVYEKFNKDNIIRGVIIGDDEIIQGAMVIKPNEEIKKKLVERIVLGGADVPNNEISVRVLNGCSVPGLGAKVADRLKSEGFNVIEVGNVQRKTPVEVTEIQDHYMNNSTADTLRNLLDVPKAPVMYKKSPNVLCVIDYTIIIGKDMEGKKFPNTGQSRPSSFVTGEPACHTPKNSPSCQTPSESPTSDDGF